MTRIKWPLAIATLFILLLGWYLWYTQEIKQALRADAGRMMEVYREVQIGLIDEELETQSLLNLQVIVIQAGLPFVLTGSDGSVQAVENLPFEADHTTPEGQQRILAYVERLDKSNLPLGDPDYQLIHYGDTKELRQLQWIPWFQAGGLLLTVLIGFTFFRYQRRAESEKAWTSMARELAHQLGTPLSSLQGWLEVLRLPAPERPGDLSDFEIAGSIGEDLERLERISLRFELIGREPDLESLSVRQVVRDLERYLAARIPRLSKKGVELLVDIPEGLPMVKGNETLLIWALENVVKNALDALAGRGGKITIYARRVGDDWVSLRIRDTGPGVDPELRDKIFEPGVTSKSGGWGVGLALSRRIVEGVHKGRIELLENVEGTTFQIRLPVADG